MTQKKQTVILVTAYGKDNYFQKKYEDIVGIYTNVKSAIRGAKADGMTNKQMDYLNSINAFYLLDVAIQNNGGGEFQVKYTIDTPCKSSYMFKTLNLD